MAKRRIGDAILTITYRDRGDYAGTITVPAGHGRRKRTWRFEDLHAPHIGFRGGISYDSPEAYDEMAKSAASFGSYYTAHNRGDDTPEWAPKPAVADAIDEAVSYAMDDQGSYHVERQLKNRVWVKSTEVRRSR